MYKYFKKPFPMNAHTKKLLVKVRAAANEYLGTPIAALPYSKFKLFLEQGSRVEYEDEYIDPIPSIVRVFLSYESVYVT